MPRARAILKSTQGSLTRWMSESNEVSKAMGQVVRHHGRRIRASYNKTLMLVSGGYHNGSHIVPYHDGQRGNRLLKELIDDPKPAMIARYGASELEAISSFLSGATSEEQLCHLRQIHKLSGFFPLRLDLLPRFVSLYEDAARELDCLAIWNFKYGRRRSEERMFRAYSPDAMLIDQRALESWRYVDPWTYSLRGKHVLVVHPFEQSIRRQYEKRRYLFQNEDVLPEFASLLTVKAVQSIAGSPTDFDTWFEALEAICSNIKGKQFDLALIGAGAYGMPLAAYVKRLGKKAIHMGGATQILFGIMGRKWEKPLANLINDYWSRPLPEETPSNFHVVEEGAYW